MDVTPAADSANEVEDFRWPGWLTAEAGELSR